MVSSSTILDFPSPLRINFAGEVVHDVDVEKEEFLLQKVSPERKSFFTFDADPQKTKGKKVSWFWNFQQKPDDKRPKRPKRSSENSSSGAIGSQFSDLDWDSDDFELDSRADSDSDTFVTMETKDTTKTYGTKGTYATVNTQQYVEFLIQEKQEDRWSAFFCGVCGRVPDEDEEEESSQSSIYTRTKPRRTYGTESHHTLSVVEDGSAGDPSESQMLGSKPTRETEQLAPFDETSFIF